MERLQRPVEPPGRPYRTSDPGRGEIKRLSNGLNGGLDRPSRSGSRPRPPRGGKTGAVCPLAHTPAGADFEVTEHAAVRWVERYVGLDLAREFYTARRMTRKQKATLRRQLPNRAWDLRADCPTGRYYLLNARGIVFVCAPPVVIVTMFPLTGDRDWRRRSAFAYLREAEQA